MARQQFGGSEPLDLEAIRQSPRQFVDLETVEKLSDYAMVCELKIARIESELAVANAEILEQCRLNGEGSEREAKLIAEIAAAKEELAKVTEQKNKMWFELAAHQLVIKQLREIVDELRYSNSSQAAALAITQYNKLKPSTEALDTYVKQAVEETIRAIGAV